ncbi:MAG: cyclodeaminase/cyclohydrolase family protein, partial [Mogibacterium sp.]|nr:cyclodeaminase/cyclohydrolase family protein [Mogibacterium sp.]
MRAAWRALELTASLLGKSNRNLVSDLYVAALNLNACIQAAKFNVLANTPYLKDREVAEAMEAEANELSAKSIALSAEILANA